MTKKAATEEKLGELHSKVAKVMSDALDVYDKAQTVYLEADSADLVDVTVPQLSGPLLSVITKFLSDNKITCVPEESAGMSDLDKKLAQRRAKRGQRNGTDGNVVGFPVAGSASEDE